MPTSKQLFIILAAGFVLALALAALVLPQLNKVTAGTSTAPLPPGCVKPTGGFLLVASQLGYNDSVEHGVPQNSWPVIDVRQGQNVTIVVCNADPTQAHGFQISHYYDARLVSIASGQVLTVSFTAAEAGSFRVYCSIPCTVHWAMQSGELVVS
jgi:hypothetical protein